MDIQILLFLQNIRQNGGSFLNSFFTFITTIAVDYYVFVPALVLFWCIDKKRGSKVLLSWGTALGVGAFLKTIFCVYRPWIRDARIQPPDDVLTGATGYSFPSGHSVSSGGFWNGLAVSYKKYKPLVVFCVCMVFITMFSRLYFGVHTPQDVLVGCAVGLLCAIGMGKLCDVMDAHPDRDWIVLAAATVLVAALLCYISFKQYPMDYIDGQLIVDPKKMTVDGFKDPGRFYGIVLGWFLERRFVRFDAGGTAQQKVMRALVGGILVIFWWTAVITPLGKAIGIGIVHFFLQATTPVLFMTVYPVIFKKLETRHKALTE